MLKKIIKKIRFELQFNNPNYYVRIKDKIFKTYYQNKLRRKIHELNPIKLMPGNVLTMAIMANHANFYESVATLYSFCYWKNDIAIHYHEDGTLTQTEIDFLNKIFPGINILKREEENISINNYLMAKGLTNSAELRSYYLFALRLFDMIVYKKTPYLMQIDSDVLIFNKPTEILDIIANGQQNGCYNNDYINAYTFNPQTMAKYLQVPVLDRFNAGLLLHNFDETFFDFIETILEGERGSINSWHIEQTLFAMYATAKGNFVALPNYYDLGRQQIKLGNKVTSEHYCHNTGYNFHKDFLYKISPLFTK